MNVLCTMVKKHLILFCPSEMKYCMYLFIFISMRAHFSVILSSSCLPTFNEWTTPTFRPRLFKVWRLVCCRSIHSLHAFNLRIHPLKSLSHCSCVYIIAVRKLTHCFLVWQRISWIRITRWNKHLNWFRSWRLQLRNTFTSKNSFGK